jgi:hypothetical protein
MGNGVRRYKPERIFDLAVLIRQTIVWPPVEVRLLFRLKASGNDPGFLSLSQGYRDADMIDCCNPVNG